MMVYCTALHHIAPWHTIVQNLGLDEVWLSSSGLDATNLYGPDAWYADLSLDKGG
jgi:hypothetical protein